MKFFAILEDSFREAIASYVCMVQIALSVVFVLLLASVSYTPMEARSALQPLGNNLIQAAYADADSMRVLAGTPLAMRDPFQISNIEPLESGASGPGGCFRITLAVQCLSVESALRLRQNPDEIRALIQELFGKVGDKRYVKVTDDVRLLPHDNRPFAASAVPFQFTVNPTSNTPLLWPHTSVAFFGLVSLDQHGMPLGRQLWEIENYVVNVGAAWVVILLSIVVTAFLVPNMLRKGSVDLLLVRPMHRVRLLLYKYLCGVLYILANVGLLVAALWLVLGVRTGVWKPGVLLTIPVLTFFFAILFAVSVFYGVLTRSAVTAILVTCIAWFGLWLVGAVHATVDQTRNDPSWEPWVIPLVDTLHAVLPRTSDLNLLMTKVLTRELLDDLDTQRMGMGKMPALTWGESLTVSFAFVTVLLGLASWRFYRKDY